MIVKATLTDLQTRRVYHGALHSDIIQGKDLAIKLDGPNRGYIFTITRIRGWLNAIDDDQLFYLFDVHGKRFKVRITQPVIDSKP